MLLWTCVGSSIWHRWIRCQKSCHLDWSDHRLGTPTSWRFACQLSTGQAENSDFRTMSSEIFCQTVQNQISPKCLWQIYPDPGEWMNINITCLRWMQMPRSRGWRWLSDRDFKRTLVATAPVVEGSWPLIQLVVCCFGYGPLRQTNLDMENQWKSQVQNIKTI